MSNLIPPLLSSSPPPIVGPLEEDDDDEFGDFRAAAGSFDCDDFSLPPSPQKSPEKELKTDFSKVNLDINSNKSQKTTGITQVPTENLNGSISPNDLAKDYQDKRKSPELEEFSFSNNSSWSEVSKTFNIQNAIVHDEAVNSTHQTGEPVNYNQAKNDHLEAPTLTNVSEETNSDMNDLRVVENLFDGFTESVLDKTNSDELSEVNETDVKFEEDCLEEVNSENADKDEMCDNSPKETNYDLSESSMSLKLGETDPKFSDDEFGDFENHFAPQTEENQQETDDEFDSFVVAPAVAEEGEADEDFGDFESSEFGNFSAEDSQIIEINEKNAAEKAGTILMEIFPKFENGADYIAEVIQNAVFDELKEITETNALIYQWSKSNSQKMFLKALNIDTRNILYGPAWNSSMPRFAANLGLTPLEPMKTETLTPTPFQNISSPSVSSQKGSDVPTAQFDWSDSGLINPLDSTPTQRPEIATEDSSQPNIATLPPPTLEKIDSFTSAFETEGLDKQLEEPPPSELSKPVGDLSPFQSPKLIPLRETHICNDLNDLGKPGWLQPTILTPDLPRKEPVSNRDDDDDEFDDFQMVLPEEKPQENEVKVEQELTPQLDTKSEHKHIFTNFISPVQKESPEEEEFTEFHSSVAPSVVTPLQHVSLEPLKPSIQYSQPAQINWPDPGVTDEEIRYIDLSYSRNPEPKVEDKKARVDDEEWSDFVSVSNPPKSVLPERTATPDLPLSVLNLNSVHAPRQPIPVITPSGLMQTKLTSKVSQSVVQTSVQPATFRPPSNLLQPAIISNHFAANFPTANDDDDDWSDFVSSQPQMNGYQQKAAPNLKNQVNWSGAPTNIIMNPTHFASLPSQSKKTAIPSISALPDLEFIAPKKRTSKK